MQLGIKTEQNFYHLTSDVELPDYDPVLDRHEFTPAEQAANETKYYTWGGGAYQHNSIIFEQDDGVLCQLQ